MGEGTGVYKHLREGGRGYINTWREGEGVYKHLKGEEGEGTPKLQSHQNKQYMVEGVARKIWQILISTLHAKLKVIYP